MCLLLGSMLTCFNDLFSRKQILEIGVFHVTEESKYLEIFKNIFVLRYYILQWGEI